MFNLIIYYQDINEGFLNGLWIKKDCYELLIILILLVFLNMSSDRSEVTQSKRS